jgi:uncharacterized protein YcbK (DUF882 family)
VPRRRPNPRARLSAHFVAQEFAPRGGEPLSAAFLEDARQLCQMYLEPLRRSFGAVTIISGQRTATHNEEVGGARRSMHVKIRGRRGAAADLICARGTARDWYEFLDALAIPGLGFYDDHIHADNRRGRARW